MPVCKRYLLRHTQGTRTYTHTTACKLAKPEGGSESKRTQKNATKPYHSLTVRETTKCAESLRQSLKMLLSVCSLSVELRVVHFFLLLTMCVECECVVL